MLYIDLHQSLLLSSEMLFLQFILLQLFIIGTAYASCTVSAESCDFYLCQENLRHCGEDGYPLAFGYRHCQAFLEDQSQFNLRTQDWLQNVRVNLMQKTAILPLDISCDDFAAQAFAIHVPAYEETGFCQLSFVNKIRISRYFRELFLDSRFLRTVVRIERSCLHPLIYKP